MKIGDLVKFRRGHDLWWSDDDCVGVVTDLSEPTLLFPFQVATVVCETQVFDGVSVRALEKISV